MLFLLTGDIQIGKSRWLDALCADLVKDGIGVKGVLAPGVWRERSCDEKPRGVKGAGDGRFEKLGIDNVLLPGRRRIPFARRRDLALAEGTYDKNSQSAAVNLVWEISEDAIKEVNSHFDHLASGGPTDNPELIVVDELGRLELACGGGLTSAVSMLDAGPFGASTHALVVVRDWLLDCARERFGKAWGGAAVLTPDDNSRAMVRAAFGLASHDSNAYY